MRLLLILAAACMTGCAILPRNAVPVDRMPEAVVPGMPDVRALAGAWESFFVAVVPQLTAIHERSLATLDDLLSRALDGEPATLLIAGDAGVGIGFDQIEVVVHPQSIVHSMVEFTDGAGNEERTADVLYRWAGSDRPG